MYFVTGMTSILNETTPFDSEEAKNNASRCFGYFKEMNDAFDNVRRNTCDMYETMYSFIVIEKIEEGIHPFSEIIQWFEYNKDSDSYEPVEIGRTGFCNYAIG